jgi:heme/copper-type cytochrome/quinol oxidase subunit 3
MSVAVRQPALTIPHATIEDRRGSHAMLLFILTEAMLFVALFFAYYYLGHVNPKWPPEAPKLTLPLTMLAALLASSGTLHWGEALERQGRVGGARLAIAVTMLLGVAFLAMQAAEYREKLTHLRPTTDACGSIFYTITSVHAAHLTLGLLMLGYVLLLPEIGPGRRPPHKPLHNAALYWHFVDVVWVVIVALVYVAPHLGGR